MNLEKLLDIAENDGIGIHDFPMKNNIALSVRVDGECDIAIDFSKTKSNYELKSLLAHELGHCETMSFYNRDNYLDIASKQEYRANSWAVKALLPRGAFLRAIYSGCNEVWKLSEHFNVEPHMVVFALKFYFGIEV